MVNNFRWFASCLFIDSMNVWHDSFWSTFSFEIDMNLTRVPTLLRLIPSLGVRPAIPVRKEETPRATTGQDVRPVDHRSHFLSPHYPSCSQTPASPARLRCPSASSTLLPVYPAKDWTGWASSWRCPAGSPELRGSWSLCAFGVRAAHKRCSTGDHSRYKNIYTRPCYARHNTD